MAARRRTQVVAKAVVFLLLLSGSEVAAIRTNVLTEGSGSEESVQAAVDDWFFRGATAWLSGGSDVCRTKDLKSESGSVARYHAKMKTVRDLTEKLESEACSRGCLTKWKELQKRIMRFGSCAKAIEDEKNNTKVPRVPEGLREVITSGPDALQEGLRAPVEALTKAVDRNKIFPTFKGIPDCAFKPFALDAKTALAHKDIEKSESEFRKQLFGEKCSKESSKVYVERLSGMPRKIADNTLGQVAKMLDIKKAQQDAHEVDSQPKTVAAKEKTKKQAAEKVAENIEDIVKQATVEIKEAGEAEVASSLLEVDDEETGWFKLRNIIIFLICFFVCLFIVAFIVSFVTTGGASAFGAAMAWPFVSLWSAGLSVGVAAAR